MHLQKNSAIFNYRKIKELKPSNVLEVGCGQGFQLLILSRLFPEISFVN